MELYERAKQLKYWAFHIQYKYTNFLLPLPTNSTYTLIIVALEKRSLPCLTAVSLFASPNLACDRTSHYFNLNRQDAPSGNLSDIKLRMLHKLFDSASVQSKV
jgi:hypothetical protein